MEFSENFSTRLHDQAFVQKLLHDRVLMMDSSEFGYWSACFVKGIFYGGVRRSSKANQAALAFGDAIHKGLAAYYLGEPLEACMDAVRAQALENDLESLMDEKRTTEKAVMMIEAYIHDTTIQKSKFAILEVEDVPMVEKSFTVPLGEIDTQFGIVAVMWTGIMDAIVYYENALYVLDHKTTSMMGPQFIDDKVRGNQVNGYTYAGRYLTQNLTRNVDGAIINALCHRKTGFEFKNFPIPVPAWKIEEWKTETLLACGEIVNKIAQMLTSTPEAVPNRESCVTKYGRCPYFDLCDTPAMTRERTLFDDSFFKDNDWDPLKKAN